MMTVQEFFCKVWLAGINIKRLPAPPLKTFTPRSPCLKKINPDRGKWVFYQLRLRSLTFKDVAVAAGCSRPHVSNVLRGYCSSSKVYEAVCNMLGLSSVSELFV